MDKCMEHAYSLGLMPTKMPPRKTPREHRVYAPPGCYYVEGKGERVAGTARGLWFNQEGVEDASNPNGARLLETMEVQRPICECGCELPLPDESSLAAYGGSTKEFSFTVSMDIAGWATKGDRFSHFPSATSFPSNFIFDVTDENLAEVVDYMTNGDKFVVQDDPRYNNCLSCQSRMYVVNLTERVEYVSFSIYGVDTGAAIKAYTSSDCKNWTLLQNITEKELGYDIKDPENAVVGADVQCFAIGCARDTGFCGIAEITFQQTKGDNIALGAESESATDPDMHPYQATDGDDGTCVHVADITIEIDSSDVFRVSVLGSDSDAADLARTLDIVIKDTSTSTNSTCASGVAAKAEGAMQLAKWEANCTGGPLTGDRVLVTVNGGAKVKMCEIQANSTTDESEVSYETETFASCDLAEGLPINTLQGELRPSDFRSKRGTKVQFWKTWEQVTGPSVAGKCRTGPAYNDDEYERNLMRNWIDPTKWHDRQNLDIPDTDTCYRMRAKPDARLKFCPAMFPKPTKMTCGTFEGNNSVWTPRPEPNQTGWKSIFNVGQLVCTGNYLFDGTSPWQCEQDPIVQVHVYKDAGLRKQYRVVSEKVRLWRRADEGKDLFSMFQLPEKLPNMIKEIMQEAADECMDMINETWFCYEGRFMYDSAWPALHRRNPEMPKGAIFITEYAMADVLAAMQEIVLGMLAEARYLNSQYDLFAQVIGATNSQSTLGSSTAQSALSNPFDFVLDSIFANNNEAKEYFKCLKYKVLPFRMRYDVVPEDEQEKVVTMARTQVVEVSSTETITIAGETDSNYAPNFVTADSTTSGLFKRGWKLIAVEGKRYTPAVLAAAQALGGTIKLTFETDFFFDDFQNSQGTRDDPLIGYGIIVDDDGNVTEVQPGKKAAQLGVEVGMFVLRVSGRSKHGMVISYSWDSPVDLHQLLEEHFTTTGTDKFSIAFLDPAATAASIGNDDYFKFNEVQTQLRLGMECGATDNFELRDMWGDFKTAVFVPFRSKCEGCTTFSQLMLKFVKNLRTSIRGIYGCGEVSIPEINDFTGRALMVFDAPQGMVGRRLGSTPGYGLPTDRGMFQWPEQNSKVWQTGVLDQPDAQSPDDEANHHDSRELSTNSTFDERRLQADSSLLDAIVAGASRCGTLTEYKKMLKNGYACEQLRFFPTDPAEACKCVAFADWDSAKSGTKKCARREAYCDCTTTPLGVRECVPKTPVRHSVQRSFKTQKASYLIGDRVHAKVDVGNAKRGDAGTVKGAVDANVPVEWDAAAGVVSVASDSLVASAEMDNPDCAVMPCKFKVYQRIQTTEVLGYNNELKVIKNVQIQQNILVEKDALGWALPRRPGQPKNHVRVLFDYPMNGKDHEALVNKNYLAAGVDYDESFQVPKEVTLKATDLYELLQWEDAFDPGDTVKTTVLLDVKLPKDSQGVIVADYGPGHKVVVDFGEATEREVGRNLLELVKAKRKRKRTHYRLQKGKVGYLMPRPLTKSPFLNYKDDLVAVSLEDSSKYPRPVLIKKTALSLGTVVANAGWSAPSMSKIATRMMKDHSGRLTATKAKAAFDKTMSLSEEGAKAPSTVSTDLTEAEKEKEGAETKVAESETASETAEKEAADAMASANELQRMISNKYAVMAEGANKCDTDTTKVTEAECRASAPRLQANIGAAFSEDVSTLPTGCYLVMDSNVVIFNRHATGQGAAGRHPICKPTDAAKQKWKQELKDKKKQKEDADKAAEEAKKALEDAIAKARRKKAVFAIIRAFAKAPATTTTEAPGEPDAEPTAGSVGEVIDEVLSKRFRRQGAFMYDKVKSKYQDKLAMAFALEQSSRLAMERYEEQHVKACAEAYNSVQGRWGQKLQWTHPPPAELTKPTRSGVPPADELLWYQKNILMESCCDETDCLGSTLDGRKKGANFVLMMLGNITISKDQTSLKEDLTLQARAAFERYPGRIRVSMFTRDPLDAQVGGLDLALRAMARFEFGVKYDQERKSWLNGDKDVSGELKVCGIHQADFISQILPGSKIDKPVVFWEGSLVGKSSPENGMQGRFQFLAGLHVAELKFADNAVLSSPTLKNTHVLLKFQKDFGKTGEKETDSPTASKAEAMTGEQSKGNYGGWAVSLEGQGQFATEVPGPEMEMPGGTVGGGGEVSVWVQFAMLWGSSGKRFYGQGTFSWALVDFMPPLFATCILDTDAIKPFSITAGFSGDFDIAQFLQNPAIKVKGGKVPFVIEYKAQFPWDTKAKTTKTDDQRKIAGDTDNLEPTQYRVTEGNEMCEHQYKYGGRVYNRTECVQDEDVGKYGWCRTITSWGRCQAPGTPHKPPADSGFFASASPTLLIQLPGNKELELPVAVTAIKRGVTFFASIPVAKWMQQDDTLKQFIVTQDGVEVVKVAAFLQQWTNMLNTFPLDDFDFVMKDITFIGMWGSDKKEEGSYGAFGGTASMSSTSSKTKKKKWTLKAGMHFGGFSKRGAFESLLAVSQKTGKACMLVQYALSAMNSNDDLTASMDLKSVEDDLTTVGSCPHPEVVEDMNWPDSNTITLPMTTTDDDAGDDAGRRLDQARSAPRRLQSASETREVKVPNIQAMVDSMPSLPDGMEFFVKIPIVAPKDSILDKALEFVGMKERRYMFDIMVDWSRKRMNVGIELGKVDLVEGSTGFLGGPIEECKFTTNFGATIGGPAGGVKGKIPLPAASISAEIKVRVDTFSEFLLHYKGTIGVNAMATVGELTLYSPSVFRFKTKRIGIVSTDAKPSTLYVEKLHGGVAGVYALSTPFILSADRNVPKIDFTPGAGQKLYTDCQNRPKHCVIADGSAAIMIFFLPPPPAGPPPPRLLEFKVRASGAMNMPNLFQVRYGYDLPSFIYSVLAKFSPTLNLIAIEFNDLNMKIAAAGEWNGMGMLVSAERSLDLSGFTGDISVGMSQGCLGAKSGSRCTGFVIHAFGEDSRKAHDEIVGKIKSIGWPDDWSTSLLPSSLRQRNQMGSYAIWRLTTSGLNVNMKMKASLDVAFLSKSVVDNIAPVVEVQVSYSSGKLNAQFWAGFGSIAQMHVKFGIFLGSVSMSGGAASVAPPSFGHLSMAIQTHTLRSSVDSHARNSWGYIPWWISKNILKLFDAFDPRFISLTISGGGKVTFEALFYFIGIKVNPRLSIDMNQLLYTVQGRLHYVVVDGARQMFQKRPDPCQVNSNIPHTYSQSVYLYKYAGFAYRQGVGRNWRCGTEWYCAWRPCGHYPHCGTRCSWRYRSWCWGGRRRWGGCAGTWYLSCSFNYCCNCLTYLPRFKHCRYRWEDWAYPWSRKGYYNVFRYQVTYGQCAGKVAWNVYVGGDRCYLYHQRRDMSCRNHLVHSEYDALSRMPFSSTQTWRCDEVWGRCHWGWWR
eukprot:TRINITY_DN3770_c0_g1_i7.p1 TRINITY_DN3770_c0_g1~~TRINITY_DN3770_c0_g1_i7.p1  ORF type:complete len:3697 (-),score=644.83 TRINITY_DN3770_c0_g1_i7:202-10239(-)